MKFSKFTIHTMAKLSGIRVVLAEKDLKQQMATDKLGTNQATISWLVTNTTQPSLLVVLDIASRISSYSSRIGKIGKV